MTEPDGLRAPKHIVFTMGVVIIILAVAVLILLLNNSGQPPTVEPDDVVISDGVNVPIPPELEKWIRSQGFSTLMFVKESKVKVVTPAGRERKPTCQLNGTEVPETCELNGIDIENLNSMELFSLKINPDCDGQRIGNRLYTWHTNRDPGGRWKAGADHCHNKGASYHD